MEISVDIAALKWNELVGNSDRFSRREKQMNIPINDQETVINFTRDSDKATVYTTDTTMRSKLHNLSMKNGKDWVLLNQDTDSIDHDIISETYQCPKKLIGLRVLSRKLTEEQRQAAAERLRKARENK